MSWVKVVPVEDIPAGGAIVVDIDGTQVAVVCTGDSVYAVSDLCSHAEVSLSEGEVYETTIECWLHGSCFDLRTGKPTSPPATQPITTYRVQVEGGNAYVSPGSEE